jgi:hypothetical protein
MLGPLPEFRTMPTEQPTPTGKLSEPQPASYFENGLLVYTAAYHLNRGYCCGSGCRHCPYDPRHVEGNKQVRR